jgi:hypothetical protein
VQRVWNLRELSRRKRRRDGVVEEATVTDLQETGAGEEDGGEVRENLKFPAREDSAFESESDSSHKSCKFVHKSHETNPSALVLEKDVVTLGGGREVKGGRERDRGPQNDSFQILH